MVVTGLGAVAPNGIGVEAFWRGLLSGVSAVRRVTAFDPSKNECQIAAEVDFNPAEYFPPRRVRELWRFSQFAVAAAKFAVEDAGITIDRTLAGRTGVCFGTSVNGMGEAEDIHERFLTEGATRRIIPVVIGCPPHSAASQIAIELGITGPAVTVSSNCCTGLDAIATGWSQIASGRTELAIAGGAEAPIYRFAFSSFEALGLLSKRNEEPTAASRPYDAIRDGLVLGEGAGALVLEELHFARDRGARIYAELAGFASAGEGADMRKSDASGLALASAITTALNSAELTTADIDYINAHGSSLPDYDVCDTNAFKVAFGRRAYSIPTSSIKSMLGQAVSASGAFQAVASCLSIRDGIIPPTANYEYPDPQCDLDYVPKKPRPGRVRNVLMNAHGIGGGFSVLILRPAPRE